MSEDERSNPEGRLVRVYFADKPGQNPTPPAGPPDAARPPAKASSSSDLTRTSESTARLSVEEEEKLMSQAEPDSERPPQGELPTRPAIPRREIIEAMQEPAPLVYQNDARVPLPPDQRSRPGRMLTILGLLLVILSLGAVVVGWALLSGSDLGQMMTLLGLPPAASPAVVAPTGTQASAPAPTSTVEQISPSTPRPTATVAPLDTPAPAGPELVIEVGGARMLLVAGGAFTMGSTAAGSDAPPHEVGLDPFYIDATEVTNAQWESCVASGDCLPPADLRAYDGSPYYSESAFADYPVIYVNWNDARAFCEWRGARLPTEAEWEMAAAFDPASGSVSLFPWGDEWGPLRANHCDAGCILAGNAEPAFDDGYSQTAPVGSYPDGRSAIGALDMAGNVAEWVSDWYSSSYYADSPAENPSGPESGTFKVVRGGAWGVGETGMLSSRRSSFLPTDSGPGVGFRCAIGLDELAQ